jgi:hypothetical protein
MAVSLKEQLRLQRELGVTVKKRNRGGRRDGAGRKPIGDEPREKFGTRFSKEVMDFIDETSVGITKTELVEKILKDSIEFRTWNLVRQS